MESARQINCYITQWPRGLALVTDTVDTVKHTEPKLDLFAIQILRHAYEFELHDWINV